MKGNWTVGKKLFTAVGVLVALMLGIGGYAWWSAQVAHDRFADAHERAEKMKLAGVLELMSFEVYAAEKVLVLSGYDNDKKNYDTWLERAKEADAKFDKAVEEILPLIHVQSDKDAILEAKRLLDESHVNGKEVQALIEAGKFHEAQMLSREKNRPIVDAIDKAIAHVFETQEKGLAEAEAAGTAAARVEAMVILFALVASVLVAAATVYAVKGIVARLRIATNEIRSTSEQVLAASTQVASSSQSLSQGATEQAASLEETSASMEEMASMTRRNAENSQQAAGLVSETEGAVRDSNAALEDMVSAMAGIRESSAKISKIIKTIDEIAFQTNILALNAAVEAARAGEAGMGFAVVADEVRNLAQRSAQAAKDTASLIEDAITRSQQGSAKVEHMATVIGTITDKASKVKALVDEISVASRQQTQGIDQVTQAVAQMEKVTQTTAATAEESAAASEELNSQAEMSMQTVGELEALVGGGVSPVSRVKLTGQPRPVAAPGDGKVLRMTPPAKPAAVKAEEAIPFGDTGTYGKF